MTQASTVIVGNRPIIKGSGPISLKQGYTLVHQSPGKLTCQIKELDLCGIGKINGLVVLKSLS